MKGKYQRCEVSSMSQVNVVGNHFDGFEKTYYPDGYVKTLRVRKVYFSAGASVNSMRFEFTYEGNIIHVSARNQIYHLNFLEDDPETPDPEIRKTSFDIVVDEKTGNALSVGYSKYQYKDGRLISLTTYWDEVFNFEYDSRGNVTRAPGGRFEYDYKIRKC